MATPTLDTNIRKLVTENRRAFYDYFIDEEIEAGIILTGSEVKSMRSGKTSINESHVGEIDGALHLLGSFIPEYDKASTYNHSPRRPRKLLLKKRQMQKLLGLITKKGMTIVPLKIYFNSKNIAKVGIGIARGKKLHDKRQTIKDREWARSKDRESSAE